MSEATDDEIASIFWRDTTKGTSDPFCWSGDTMFCHQVLAGVFVKGYRAALAEAAQAPKGWVLVPLEPTRAMCLAAQEERKSYPIRSDANSPVVLYRAMLAAAPQHETPQ